MPQLETKHYLLICTMLVAVGTQFSGAAHGWADVTTPSFIGGTLVLIGTQIASLFVGAPQKPWTGEDRRSDPSPKP